MATDSMTVKINPNDKGNPVGKLADAELHFIGGPLEGLKLIGFGIWERRGASARNVTFPARQYSVNGEKRTFHASTSDRRFRGPGARPGSRAGGVRRIRGTRGKRVDRPPERPSRALRPGCVTLSQSRQRLHVSPATDP